MGLNSRQYSFIVQHFFQKIKEIYKTVQKIERRGMKFVMDAILSLVKTAVHSL